MKSILKLAPLILTSQLLSQEMALDKIIIETGTYWEIPGCAVSIVRNDEIVLCKGYGVKELGKAKDNAIDTHTRFPIASLSKLFTSVAFGILLDRGTLTLDTPVQKFYPLKLSDPYAAAHLSFRDCLSMRSGLPGPSTNDLVFGDPNATRQQLLEKILPSLPFSLGFRSHFSYQNLLYLLAATPFKPSYQSFLKKELFAPLEMSETFTANADLQNSSNKATPHISKNGRFTPIPYENMEVFLPAAGLISTAHDMSHFLLFLLQSGTYNAKNLLTPATLSEIFTAQTTATTSEFTGSAAHRDILFPTAQFLNYGLGCFLHDYQGIKIIQIPGVTDGVMSVLALVPSHKLGIFITVNAQSDYFLHALLYQLIDSFLGYKNDWNAVFSQIPSHS